MRRKLLRFFDREQTDEIRIREVRTRGNEVRGSVAGREIWFQADGVKLRADAMAYALAYFIPAQVTSQSMRLYQKIDGRLPSGLSQISAQMSEWWGYGPEPKIIGGRRKAPSTGNGSRTGLFFSCGVDSITALIENMDEVDDLILIHGFDVKVSDQERFDGLRKQAQAIADHCGKRLIIVKTNLRDHRLSYKVRWAYHHGAAIAAIGHLLSDEYDQILISASHYSGALHPWGSHPLIDHYWSTPNLRFRHAGDGMWRSDKLQRYGAHPLLQEYLAVCWEASGLPINCGSCEKCVRNQLGFPIAGHPIPKTFPKGKSLAKAIFELDAFTIISDIYSKALSSEYIEDSLKEALRDLLARSNRTDEATTSGDSKGWNDQVVVFRIADAKTRKRHEAGSPNELEIDTYESFLSSPEVCQSSTAVILGMTPELRKRAAERFGAVVALDRERASISSYRDWRPMLLDRLDVRPRRTADQQIEQHKEHGVFSSNLPV